MADVFSRQQFIVNRAKLEQVRVGIIGCGAIGRQAALHLAAMGLERVVLVDPDTIELHNIPTQLWHPDNIGDSKVGVLADEFAERSPLEPDVRVIPFEWTHSVTHDCDVLFVCVDSMSVRKEIFDHYASSDKHTLLVDARMLGLVIRVLTATTTTCGRYSETLFSDEQAAQGSCVSEAVGFTAGIAAGLMCNEFALWLRDMPVAEDTLISLFSHEMSTPERKEVTADVN